MAFSKRSHGERDAPRTSKPTGEQRLYLIFDDYEFGYSIRQLNLLNAGTEQRRLPPPFIGLEARRGFPQFFTALGTKILFTHPRDNSCEIVPMLDVRSRDISFAPGELYPQHPIYIPVGDEIFALDMETFKVLSMKPILRPPGMKHEDGEITIWNWFDLPMPSFNTKAVTTYASYAVDSDRQAILFSTDDATFAFDPVCKEWEKRAEWSLPFSGRAYFVHDLDVFVGLPKDGNAFGHLCFCRWSGDKHDVWLSKDNLSSKGLAESHVGTTLVYLGESRFCIVEFVGNGDDCPLSTRCGLTTFSLSSDTNGILTVAETAAKCYKVPEGTSYLMRPVAFWL